MKKLICSQRYNTTIVRYQKIPITPPTPLQTAHRERFKAAMQLALVDMQDPITRAKWADQAQLSNAKYRTPRGAAFAHYYKLMQER